MSSKADQIARIEQAITEATLALRAAFLEKVPVFTRAELSTRSTRPEAIEEWRLNRRVFAIDHGEEELYPAFQFSEGGQPVAFVAEILAILDRDVERTDWDNALWFAGETGWLDGQRPIDCLTADPDAVRLAAEQETLRDTE
jgi:hypothetical protein